MLSLVGAVGMVGASAAGHDEDAGELASAIFAEVLAFLTALVEGMPSTVCTIGMAGAGGRGELADIGKLVAAVLAIVVFLCVHRGFG